MLPELCEEARETFAWEAGTTSLPSDQQEA